MVKRFDGIFVATAMVVSAVFVHCVPTSVLVNSKAVASGTSGTKVKRAPNNPHPNGHVLESNTKEKPTTVNQDQDIKRLPPQKRGVNSQYFDRELPADIYANNYPNGVWEDPEPGVVYPPLQDFDDYRAQYHPKTYENLQNMLNANMYEEPIALPIQYQYPRYFSDRKKRSNGKNNLLMRLKRESKLTPADMLALVALVEAGRQSRYDEELPLDVPIGFQKSQSPSSVAAAAAAAAAAAGSPYDLPRQEDNFDWYSPWADSQAVAAEYYGMPYENLDGGNHFESAKETHQSPYPSKRFMVAKKKRSLGGTRDWHFGQERVHNIPKISVTPGFDSRISLPEMLDNGSRKYHTKYF